MDEKTLTKIVAAVLKALRESTGDAPTFESIRHRRRCVIAYPRDVFDLLRQTGYLPASSVLAFWPSDSHVEMVVRDESFDLVPEEMESPTWEPMRIASALPHDPPSPPTVPC